MKEENKTEFIIVRVSKKEKELLIKRAQIVHGKVSAYVRNLLNLKDE